MIITLAEIFDLAFMTVMLGLIFMNFFKRMDIGRPNLYPQGFFDYKKFKLSVIAVAPAIILHEMAHKFLAIGFGMSATFHAAYLWLLIGLALSMTNFGILFFVPAFVSISSGTPLQTALTAGAGPFMNLFLWIGALLVLKYKLVKKKYSLALHLTKQINMFLFIFNMIPIPMFDGAKFFGGLLSYFSNIF